MKRALRLLLVLAPWIVLAGVVSTHALWFEQRRSLYRFGAWAACALLSVALTRRRDADSADRNGGVQATIAVVAALAGAQGVSLGLSATGVILSIALSAAAVFAWRERTGGRAAAMKVVAATLATLLTAGATETAARLLHVGEKARESDSRDLARRFNNLTPPRSAFVNQPSTLDEFPPALIEINSIGTRGPELGQGAVDLLLLGDSFIEARQLPFEQTLGPQLAAILARRAPGTRVVSHGMRGWSPLLEWNWYLKVGRQFHAKRVLLFFFWNDLWPEGTEVRTFHAALDARGRPDYFEAPVDPAWLWYKPLRTVRIADEVVRLIGATSARRVFQAATGAGGSRTATALDVGAAQAEARRLVGEPPLTTAQLDAVINMPLGTLPLDLKRLAAQSFWPGIRPLSVWSPENVEAARHTEAELAAFAEDVRADGGRLVIVYVPNPLQVGAGECSVGRLFDRVEPGALLPADSGIQAWLRSVTSSHGIEFMDPTGAMRDRGAQPGGGPLFYLRADCHWSPTGHAFMADWLADWYLGRPAS